MLVTVADFTSPTVLSYPITVSDGKTSFTQRFGVAVIGNTTGIGTVQSSMFNVQSSKYYNLQGQRLTQPQKGLNIVNGKIVIIR